MTTTTPVTTTTAAAAGGSASLDLPERPDAARLRHEGVVDVVHVERLVREGMNRADHVVSGERPHH